MADPTEQIQPGLPRVPTPETGITAADVNANAPPVTVSQAPASLARLDLILMGLLLGLAFLLGSFAAANSDVWLNLASGRQIAQGEWTIGVDPFSFTTEATPATPAVRWVQQSWLFSLGFYLLYNLIGGAGLVILKAGLVAALAWCLLQIPGGRSSRFIAVIYVGLALLAMSSQFVLRPMIVSMLFFAITLLICYRAGALGSAEPHPRTLWWLPLLFLAWANLDAWFLLGPLTLLLLWVGHGLGILLGLRGKFPGTTLAAVLGVSLLACLVNPHFIYVFMLPPEFAYPIVNYISVPDFLGAGGQALRNQHLIDPDYYPPLSLFDAAYYRNPVVGLAYWSLAILGLISFLVNAIRTPKPGIPPFEAGRVFLWLLLAALSLTQVRLIPWFAIVTVPVTLLNLADWQTGAPVKEQRNWRPAYLGRTLVFVISLSLYFFAWPGWLHVSNGEQYPHRVAWDMPIDPSSHQAAEYLAELNKNGKGLRVFDLSPEIAHYCAWLAPGVKCFLDIRWPLYQNTAAQAARIRFGLTSNQKEAREEALAGLAHWKIDYVALANFQASRPLAARMWLDEAHWLQKYGDGKTLIFAWSYPEPKFAGAFRQVVARRAFGPVAEDQRAPLKATSLLQEEISLWEQYWHGLPKYPLKAMEAKMRFSYFQIMAGRNWQNSFIGASMVARGAEAAGPGVNAILGTYAVTTIYVVPVRLYKWKIPFNGNLFLKSRDFGPPGAPLLMMRCARQAVADSPQHPQVYLDLAQAVETLANQQEDYWANYRGNPELNRSMRYKIRQIQILTALQTYLDLHPDDIQINEFIAIKLRQMNFLDVALAHYRQAAKIYDLYRPNTNNKQELEFFNKNKTALEKRVRDLEETVNKNREQYALEAATKTGLAKFQLALANNRGLVQEAVDTLRGLKRESLNAREKEAADFSLAELMLLMGRAGYLPADWSKAGPNFAELRVCHAAALGNYGDLDRALADLENLNRGIRSQALAIEEVRHGFNLNAVYQLPLFARVVPALIGKNRIETTAINLAGPVADQQALRGIMSLEYGDTAAALRHLQAALKMAGPGVFFFDRPIAERYAALLEAQAAAQK